MNLRKPKLAKLVDSTKSMALHSVIHDLEGFKNMVQTLLDKHTDLLTFQYTKDKIIDRIHEINDIQALYDFKVEVLPRDAMDVIARSIDELYPKEPTHVQVQVYLETITQLSKGGGDYIRENLRQRLQKLANEQSQKAGKIITLDNQIITE
jgi:hypothetical protein